MPELEVVTITPYRDGPLLVRGPVRLLGGDGEPLDPRRRTVALCRCGRSKLRPFCDGTHKQIGFRAPAGASVQLGVDAQTSARLPADDDRSSSA